MARGKAQLSPDEIMAVLRNSSLPTVVVEGSDDKIIFRRIEQLYESEMLSVLNAGGRETILRIYERRAELPDDLPIVFVADRDLWVIGEVPAAYHSDSVILTDGYSIENDAIRDGQLTDLMDNAERQRFLVELDQICKWFAAAVIDVLRGGQSQLRTHPEQILANAAWLADAAQMVEVDIEVADLYRRISFDSAKLLRGKTLLALLMRQLSYPGRAARHRPEALLDKVGAVPGHLIGGLFEAVGSRLGLTRDDGSVT